MGKQLKIRDVTLRDGQQSLFATRMNQAQVDLVLEEYRQAGFYALEVWGGAVPDSVMRYLREDPWDRLEKIKKGVGDTSLLTALSRGRNLFGYNPYPEKVIEGFNRQAVESGIGIMRIFDALNDVNNMKTTIKYVKENGGLADCAVCYTVDPKFTTKEKLKALLHGKTLPSHIFTIDYFVNKARQLEELGADMITLKDMAGLVTPYKTAELFRRFRQELSIPTDFHTHCTPGYGLPAAVMAMKNGADILDTAIMSFGGGPAAPPFELIKVFADKMGIEIDVDMKAVKRIDEKLKKIREELSEYDNYQQLPRTFNPETDSLPPEIDELFDKAIAYTQEEKNENKLIETTQAIEAYFGFPPPNENVKNAEIPGGMYSNMISQLKQLKLDHKVDRVLEMVPLVRVRAGCPPLVTPTSQIVGVQAVNCVLDESSGKPYYTNVSTQFAELVKGTYGKTPIPIDPDFREKIAGIREEKPYDASAYKKQENPALPEAGDRKLAENEKEELLLELFPAVAKPFLKERKVDAYQKMIQAKKEEEQKRIQKEKEKYNKLSDKEKMERLQRGLYNYKWSSAQGYIDIDEDEDIDDPGPETKDKLLGDE
ncbi:MAG: carboxylase [Bacteroidales bacterium]